MEIFGIMLSVPFIFVTSSIYAVIIGKVTGRLQFLIVPLLWISGLLLTMIVLEFIGIITVGPVRLRETIGPSYYTIHIALFLFAVPGMANIMKLQKKTCLLSKWYIVGICCAIFGLCAVVMQYVVSEGLFGIDGMGGPYGKP